MAYAFTQDLPFTADVYKRYRTALNAENPRGLIVWLSMEIENGVRSIEVWDSKEAFEQFLEETIRPVTDDEGFFNSTGYSPPEQEPPRHEFNVLDVKHGDHDEVEAMPRGPR